MRRVRNFSFVILCLAWLASTGSQSVRDDVERSECEDEGQGWWVSFSETDGFQSEFMANFSCSIELEFCESACQEKCSVPSYSPNEDVCDPAFQQLGNLWFFTGRCRCHADFVPEV